jgi:acetyl-CoA carboxylase carboxyltransferase component
VADVAEATDVADVERAAAAGRAPDIDALSAEVAAGRLTAREAIERLVDATATAEMDATERAELRELLTDLVANDPYLGALANRV